MVPYVSGTLIPAAERKVSEHGKNAYTGKYQHKCRLMHNDFSIAVNA